MELCRGIQSDYKIKYQKYRGARGENQLQEKDGRKMDDRLVSIENQLDKGISHHRSVLDTRV